MGLGDRLLEVVCNLTNILEPGGDADQTLRDPDCVALFG